MHTLLYLGIGLTVGAASGALGIGGGVLLVPALIFLCQFEPGRAAGTSLAVLMIPVCLPAAWKALGQGRVDLEAAVWIAAAFAVGAYAGASAVPYLSEQLLRLGFGVLLIAIGVSFVAQVNDAPLALAAMFLAGVAGVLARIPGRREAVSAPAAGPSLEYHI